MIFKPQENHIELSQRNYHKHIEDLGEEDKTNNAYKDTIISMYSSNQISK